MKPLKLFLFASILITIHFLIACGKNVVEPNVPPTVSITSGPQGIIKINSATFNWTGNDPDGSISKYYYSLDQSPPTNTITQTSKTYSNLSNGDHTFYIQAEDNEGSKSLIASWEFTCDLNTPPSAPILSIPEDIDNDGIFTITWSSSTDDDGSVSGYELQRDDNSIFSSPDQTYIVFTTQQDITLSNSGTYYFRVRAKDNDNDFSSWSNTVSITISLHEDNVSISISHATFDFGQVSLNRNTDQDITISNSSTSNATLSGSISIDGSYYSIINGGGSYSLANSESKTVSVRYMPTATGSHNGTLNITHNAVNTSNPATVSLLGEGVVGEAQILVSTSSIEYGDVAIGEFKDQQLTINNLSTATANLTGSLELVGEDYSFVEGDEQFDLSPDQVATVTIRYSPTSVAISQATLNINHNASNMSTPVSVDLVGNGVESRIDMELSDNSIDFGSVTIGSSQTRGITIVNSSLSNDTLIGSIEISGDDFAITSGAPEFNFLPGEYQVIGITYTPSSDGATSEIMSITHNSTNNASNPLAIPLYGTGYTAKPSLVITEIVIDDNNSGGSSGNDDGIAQIGETINVAIGVRNDGPGDAIGVTATAIVDAEDLPYLTLVDGDIYFSDINEGVETTQGDLDITIDAMPPGDNINFDIQLDFYYGGTLQGTTVRSGFSIDVFSNTTEVVLESNRDTYINSDRPNENYFLQNDLILGNAATGSTVSGSNKILIDFPTESIPSNATIDNATLFIKSYVGVNRPFDFIIGRITETWITNEVNWDNRPSATYNLWRTFTISNADQTWHSYDITEEMESLVGSELQAGFMLSAAGDAGIVHWVSLWSGNSDYVPYIEVTYTLP